MWSFSEEIDRDDQGAGDGPAAVSQVRQDLPVGAHAAHASGGQAHRVLRVQVRAVRHGRQVQELAALAHVAPAPRHQHQGPAGAADAVQLRPGAGVQPAPESRRQGAFMMCVCVCVLQGRTAVNAWKTH